MSKPCIVVFDDEQGFCSPYGEDPDCEGALAGERPIGVFPDRKAARTAIRISPAFAKLQKLQGQPENTDFTEAISAVKIVDAVIQSQDSE